MVVADFNVVGVAVLKPETDTPLVVDGDRVLASTVSSERMEPVAEWDFEIFHSSRHSTKYQIQNTRRFTRRPPQTPDPQTSLPAEPLQSWLRR